MKILPSEIEKKVPSEMRVAFFLCGLSCFLFGISGGQVMAYLMSK